MEKIDKSRKWHTILNWVLFGVFLWVVGNVLYQHGWATPTPYVILGKTLLVGFGVWFVLLIFAPKFVLKESIRGDAVEDPLAMVALRTGFMFILVIVGWISFIGSHSIFGDLIAGIVGYFFGGMLYVSFIALRKAIGYDLADFDAIELLIGHSLVVLGMWVCLSVADISQHSPPVERHTESTLTSNSNIGVALSGGGYRAALYHTGVLTTLEVLGYPPNRISTVSGGSIVGAFYALNGSMCKFYDAIVDGRFNLKRDLADMRNALRLPFPMRVPLIDTEILPFADFSRLDVQRNLLDDLLFNEQSLTAVSEGHKNLIVNASDVGMGFLFGFTPQGILVTNPVSSAWMPWSILDGQQGESDADSLKRLAELVAISGAFPGAFPSTRVYLSQSTPLSGITFHLSDGGIIDNSGVVSLQIVHRLSMAESAILRTGDGKSNPIPVTNRLDEASERLEVPPTGWNLSLIIASDGGRYFDKEENVEGVSTVMRAIELGGLYGIPPIAREMVNDAPVIHVSPRSFMDKVGNFRLPEDSYLDKLVDFLAQRSHPANSFAAATFFCDQQPNKIPAEGSGLITRNSLAEDIEYTFKVFKSSSTLKDTYTAEDASALFRLGVYATVLKSECIEKQLECSW